MNDSHNAKMFPRHVVYQSIVADKHLSQVVILVLRNHPTKSRELANQFGCGQYPSAEYSRIARGCTFQIFGNISKVTLCF